MSEQFAGGEPDAPESEAPEETPATDAAEGAAEDEATEKTGE